VTVPLDPSGHAARRAARTQEAGTAATDAADLAGRRPRGVMQGGARGGGRGAPVL